MTEIKRSFVGLRDDLVKLAHASYIAELLDVSLEPGEPSEDLFVLLQESFVAIDDGLSPALVSRWYELRLMDLLGYQRSSRLCRLWSRTRTGSVQRERRWAPLPRCAPGDTRPSRSAARRSSG